MAARETSPAENLERIHDEVATARAVSRKVLLAAIVLAAAAFIVECIFLSSNPLVTLLALPMILVLSGLVRTALSSVAASNRLEGYAISLEQTLAVDHSGTDGWSPSMRALPRSAMVRAWRVVQPTLFRSLFVHPHDPANPRAEWYLRKAKRNHMGRNPVERVWYQPAALVDEHRHKNMVAAYHDSNSLRLSCSLVFLLQFLLVAMGFVGAVLAFMLSNAASSQGESSFFQALGFVLVGATIIAWIVQWSSSTQHRRRLAMLENGFLSAESCTQLWPAVALAHSRAASKAMDDGEYMAALAEESLRLAAYQRQTSQIHGWIAGQQPEMEDAAE